MNKRVYFRGLGKTYFCHNLSQTKDYFIFVTLNSIDNQ